MIQKYAGNIIKEKALFKKRIIPVSLAGTFDFPCPWRGLSDKTAFLRVHRSA